MFILSENQYLLALDMDTGQLRWSDRLDVEVLLFPEMLLADGHLLVPVGSDIYYYKVSPTRQLAKICPLNVVVRAGMAMSGNRLLVADGRMLYAFRIEDAVGTAEE
jgi:hypothetical protein